MSLVAEITDAPAQTAAPALPFAVDVTTDFDTVREAWQALIAEAPHSGYQLFAWQEAFQHHLGTGKTTCIALVSDAAGLPQALLPLTIARRRGVSTASFIGGKHVNFAMGLWRLSFARLLDAAALRSILGEVARKAPAVIDVFAFANQPLAWAGQSNPLALLPHRPSPSFGYHLALGPDAEAVLERVVSSASRRKLRKKERALADEGAVTFTVARDAATIARFTDAFLAHKAARFAELGIPNVFAEPGTRDFILTAAAGDSPAIELCALMVGDEPVALFGGTIAAGRYSGMFNAMAPGPQQRHSPGELLLHHLIRHCCERGLTVFDLGAGEADYKSHICDGTDALFDLAVPVTAKGQAAAFVQDMAGQMKRRIKQSPRLWPLIVRLRRLRGRLSA